MIIPILITILVIGLIVLYFYHRNDKKINDLTYINLFTISINVHMKIKNKILKEVLKDMYRYSKRGDFIISFDMSKFFSKKDYLLNTDEKEKIVDYIIDELKERNFVIEREALFLINVRWDSSAHNMM